MSIIGDALLTKISDEKKKKYHYYADYVRCNSSDKAVKYSYLDLYNLVEYDKEYIKKHYKDSKICFLIIDNSIDDIAFFIALMELNIKPIIIHKDKLIELYLSNDDLKYMEINDDLNNIHMPFERTNPHDKRPDYSKEADFITNIDIYFNSYLSNIKNDIKLEREMINRILNYYLKKNNLLDEINNDDYDFGMLTSGTTGNFKIQKVNEKILYEKVLKNYDLKSNEKIINLTPISSISGLLFNLYIPMLSINKSVCVAQYQSLPLYKEKGEISLVLPGGKNLVESNDYYFGSDAPTNYSHIRFNHIYYMGKKLDLENIENVYRYIKELPDDCIQNYYGNTENLGLICKCGQEHLKPLYLYGLYVTNDCIIFSPDQKNVYQKSYNNGKIEYKKMDTKFNKDLFLPLLPISEDYKKDSLIIDLDGGVFNELIVNNEGSGDYGFEFINLLYLAGRQNDFIMKDDRYIFLNCIENAIKKIVGTDCVITKNNDLTTLYVVVDSPFYEHSSVKYQSELDEFPQIKKFLDKNNIVIDNYAIIDKNDLPTGIEIGKIKKDYLSKYVFPKIDLNKFDVFNFQIPSLAIMESVLSDQVSSLLGKIVSIKVDHFGNYEFNKKDFNLFDILNIIINYHALDFFETDESYFLKIDSSFISAKRPNSLEPKKNIYQIFKKIFENEGEKINIKIDFNIYEKLEFTLSKFDFDEPILAENHYDVSTLQQYSEEGTSYINEVVRCVIGKVYMDDDDTDEGFYHPGEPEDSRLNIPFYFTGYMKNGKIYLEEYYKVSYKDNIGDNKTYKLKK